MRTTLDIDNDVLQAAKELAAARNTTAGTIVSELLRKALTASSDTASKRIIMNGLRVVPPTGNVVTSEMVRELREKGV